MKGIMFDVDGTLINISIEYPRKVIKKVINELGYGEYSNDKVDNFWGGNANISRTKLIEIEFKVDTDDFLRILDKYISDFESSKKFKKLYDDVIPVLNNLKENGIPLGAVTDAPSCMAVPQIDYFLNGYFSEIVMTQGLEDVRDKPEPDGLLLCMEKMGIKDCIFVGDSDSDIMAAKRAGIESVLVDRGEHANYVEADKKIKSLYELL